MKIIFRLNDVNSNKMITLCVVKMPSSKIAIDTWNGIYENKEYTAFVADLIDPSGYTILDKNVNYESIESLTKTSISDLINLAR
ncbi:hypothetical protein QTV49_001853 [Vibrio vulnificus]|nr:hypothetical protein [Vibrio vulnificus]